MKLSFRGRTWEIWFDWPRISWNWPWIGGYEVVEPKVSVTELDVSILYMAPRGPPQGVTVINSKEELLELYGKPAESHMQHFGLGDRNFVVRQYTVAKDQKIEPGDVVGLNEAGEVFKTNSIKGHDHDDKSV